MYQNINKWACFFILLAHSCFCKAQTPASLFLEKHTATELKKDVDAVKSYLEKKNPNLYWYITKTQLNKKFDSLKTTLTQPITNAEFKYKLACVLASIGDGHMTLKFDGAKLYPEDRAKFDGSKISPIQKFVFKVLDNKLYIIENRSEDKLVTAGTEVLAIDNYPASKIISDLLLSLSSDGYNQTFKEFVLNVMFPEKYMELFGLKDSLSYSLKTNDGIRLLSLKSSPSANRLSSSVQLSNKNYSSTKYAYLKVGTFKNAFFDTYDTFFKTLKQNRTKNLILDLRDNLGGKHESMILLFSYLIDKPTFFSQKFDKGNSSDLVYGSETPVVPNEFKFTGKIYVLINGGTFSAASLIAANLQANTNATFIGTETGGGRNKCTGGTFDGMSLPNTGLLLEFGTQALVVPQKSNINGRGVMPDIPINYNINDIVSKKDLEYEWAKAQINKTIQ